jgi:hypothetical protein
MKGNLMAAATPTVVAGQVNPGGGLDYGYGGTINPQHTGKTGETRVELPGTPFTKTPVIVATPMGAYVNYAISVFNISPTGFSAYSVDMANNPVWISFDFIAMTV